MRSRYWEWVPSLRVCGESLRGFDDDGGGQVEVVVGGDGVAVLGDGGDLGERVEGAASVELGVDDGEGFDAGAELGGCFAHAFGDGANLPVFGGEQGDDAVSFAQFVGAQDDRFVSIGLHHDAIVSRVRGRGGVGLVASRRAKFLVKCTVTFFDKCICGRCQQSVRN